MPQTSRVRGLGATDEALSSRLGEVGLNPDRTTPVRGYSTGMVQRLKIAQALLHDHPRYDQVLRSLLKLAAIGTVADLVSLGSKRVCDPEPIKVFHRLKKQAERVCLTGGLRFLGGYAIPEDRTETVAAELDALGETFAQERATFVAGYGQAIEDWIALHPQWEAAIRKAVAAVVAEGKVRTYDMGGTSCDVGLIRDGVPAVRAVSGPDTGAAQTETGTGS